LVLAATPTRMSESINTRTKCLKCGFETPGDTGNWAKVELPSLGSVTQCPECGSTNTTQLRR
jgi:predicted RNA-binding Zn-ribbon protein involved in translation (DUF1610 family)